MTRTSPDVPIIAPQSNPTHPSSPPVETQSNAAASADFHLNDSSVETVGDDTDEIESELPVASGRGKINKPQVSKQRKSGDSNLPISRERLIVIKSKSKSTKNFSVHLLRELFSKEELEGRNISGSRGKHKVDPERENMIKEMVFKIYNTEPFDKEKVWGHCRKAIDSFMCKIKHNKI